MESSNRSTSGPDEELRDLLLLTSFRLSLKGGAMGREARKFCRAEVDRRRAGAPLSADARRALEGIHRLAELAGAGDEEAGRLLRLVSGKLVSLAEKILVERLQGTCGLDGGQQS